MLQLGLGEDRASGAVISHAKRPEERAEPAIAHADGTAIDGGRGGAREAGHDGHSGSLAAVFTCQHRTSERDQIWAIVLHV